MRTLALPSFRVSLLLLAAVVGLRSELLDRVAVAVANSVITESEILRQIRITALLNDERPDFSPLNKRQTAERLVEQTLIRREIAFSHYLANSTEPAKDLYSTFRERFPSEADYQRALREYNVADEEVRDAFRWQLTLLDFIDLRFRPGIQIPEDEMRAYFESRISGGAAGEGSVSFEEARSRIEEILTQERLNSALDRWLGQTRTQTNIRYMREVFQ